MKKYVIRASNITPCKKNPLTRWHGFTLIELLIVIVIISVVATFALLSINVNQNKRLESFSNQLVNTLTLAEEEALLRSVTLGLSIAHNALQFYEYHPEHKDNPWQVATDPTLSSHNLPNDIQLSLKIPGNPDVSAAFKLIISPNGDIAPFKIFVGKKGTPSRYVIIGEDNGAIHYESINEN